VTVFLKGSRFDLSLVGPDEKDWKCYGYYFTQCQIDNAELPVAGQYTVVVDGIDDYVGDYTLSLAQTND
jgi:hypothetical protein